MNVCICVVAPKQAQGDVTPRPLHDWRACTTPTTYQGMPDGSYTFQVSAHLFPADCCWLLTDPLACLAIDSLSEAAPCGSHRNFECHHLQSK